MACLRQIQENEKREAGGSEYRQYFGGILLQRGAGYRS